MSPLGMSQQLSDWRPLQLDPGQKTLKSPSVTARSGRNAWDDNCGAIWTWVCSPMGANFNRVAANVLPLVLLLGHGRMCSLDWSGVSWETTVVLYC